MAMETRSVFAENLNRLLEEHQMTKKALAQYLNVHSSTVTKWTRGEGSPRMDKIDKICSIFNISRDELLVEHSDISNNQKAKGVKIPVLGYVAGGVPLEMITDIIDDEEIPMELARSGTMFGLKIRGDSMSPRIRDGDVVIVRSQPDVESGEIAIVAVNGDMATCKQIKKHHDGIELIPFNPSHPTRFFTYDDAEKMPVTIIGKVVELRAKFE